MSTDLIKFELQEKDLQLVVSEKTLGSLTTNARQIKEMIEAALPNYDISNYSEDNIDLAKKDKAMLNNASKALNAKRLEFEREFMKPFDEFKGVVSETIKLISECSNKIDTVVKQSDAKAKDEKRKRIEAVWVGEGYDMVPLSKVFNERWLNKGTKDAEIVSDVKGIISKIKDDLVTIEAIGDDVDLLKSIYLDTLNLNSTIQYANTLRQNRERARRDAEAREAARIEAERLAAERVIEPEPVRIEQRVTETPVMEAAPVQPEIMTRTFRIFATRDQIIALGKYMNESKIKFEKV
ncbi:MAG: DUF1351 domain-containing protein [Clostridiaceae bacterium]|nr:DUF1351 domain-containing protein [Clostridiaceae bacterium]